MGRSTFEPAPSSPRWPWPDLDVFVLGSHRPPGTPDRVTIESDPRRLLDQVRAANRGGDVHLVGGPSTVEAFRRLGALDELSAPAHRPAAAARRLALQLTPFVSTETALKLDRVNVLPSGAMETVYICT